MPCALVWLMVAATAAVAQTAASPPAPPETAARREMRDEMGRSVRVAARVERIVSLAPNVTETLYALGLAEKLAGVSDFCDYPPDARSKPRVGGVLNPSIEAIVALRPDVVLAAKTANRRETVESLERLGIPVYTTAPGNVAEILTSVRHVAEVCGISSRGEELAASLSLRLDALRATLTGRKPRRVLFVVWTDPLVTIGPGTFLADALRYAGAESVVSDVAQEWPRLNLEEMVRLQPEYLVFADSHSESSSEALAARASELATRPGWRRLAAVKEKRIVIISDAINRPAPRLVDAIEQLARALHPEAFIAPNAPPKSAPGGVR